MHLLPFLHFFAFLVYLYLAVFVVVKNSKSLLNRVASLFPICLAIWSFGRIFIDNPDTPKESLSLFVNIISLGVFSFAGFFLWFVLIFTQKKKILKIKPFYLFFFIPPLLFMYAQLANFMIVDYIKMPYGWAYIWAESIWRHIFHLYYLSFMIASLWLLFNFGKKTANAIKKTQARIIFATMLISLIFGTVIDVLLPMLYLIG